MAKSRNEKKRAERRKVDAREWAQQQEKGFEPTAVKLPEGVELFKPSPGVYRVDFLPYRAGRFNMRADEGFEHFECQYDAHRIPSPDGRTRLYCCLKATFGENCPICQMIARGGLDPETVKALKVTTRHLWNVNDKPGDMKNPIKVFDTNHYNRGLGFGEMMAEAINSDEDYANFSDLENGLTLVLTVKEQTFPGGKFNAVTRIDFKPRKYTYDEDILDRVITLDECLVKTPADKLKELVMQDSDEARDDDNPRRNGNKPTSSSKKEEPDEEDEDEDSDDDEDEEDENQEALVIGDTVQWMYKKKLMKGKIVRILKNGSLAHIDTGSGKPSSVDVDELTKVEKEDDEDEDEDEEEDSEDEDEEEDESEEEDSDDSDSEDDDDDEEWEEEKPAAKKPGRPRKK